MRGRLTPDEREIVAARVLDALRRVDVPPCLNDLVHHLGGRFTEGHVRAALKDLVGDGRVTMKAVRSHRSGAPKTVYSYVPIHTRSRSKPQ